MVKYFPFKVSQSYLCLHLCLHLGSDFNHHIMKILDYFVQNVPSSIYLFCKVKHSFTPSKAITQHDTPPPPPSLYSQLGRCFQACNLPLCFCKYDKDQTPHSFIISPKIMVFVPVYIFQLKRFLWYFCRNKAMFSLSLAGFSVFVCIGFISLWKLSFIKHCSGEKQSSHVHHWHTSFINTKLYLAISIA